MYTTLYTKLDLYRRHTAGCPDRGKGSGWTRCRCPIWVYGVVGERKIRQSLGLRDWGRALKRIERWEEGKTEEVVHSPRQAVDTFLADCRIRGLRESTIERYGYLLKQLVGWAEHRQVNDLKEIGVDALAQFRSGLPGAVRTTHSEDCTRYYREKRGVWRCSCPRETMPMSTRGQHIVLQILRRFFGFAVDREWIVSNPARKLRAPLHTGTPTMPFTQEEITSILRACDEGGSLNPRLQAESVLRARALVLLLLYSGLRISDAVQLRRDRLEPISGRLLIRIMKTRVPLYIRLPQETVQALLAVPTGGEYFFWSGAGKLRVALNSARRTVHCLCWRARIEGHPHRFRDTFAVRLLEQGEDIRTVQLLLGHTSIRTTEKHYAPWVATMQSRLDQAVQKLNFVERAQSENRPSVN